VRKVRTASGAVAVQVVTRRGRQVEQVEHVGSAHTDAELALLLAAARERLSPGRDVLDLGALPVVPARMDDVADWTAEPALALQLATPAAGGRPAVVAAGGRVVGTSAEVLWMVLTSAYARLGFDVLGDDGFRAMVLARIVEPTSKAEVVRVLDEIGAPAVSLHTLFRSLARSQARDYRGQLATAALARGESLAQEQVPGGGEDRHGQSDLGDDHLGGGHDGDQCLDVPIEVFDLVAGGRDHRQPYSRGMFA